MTAFRSFMESIIDYAGLFPPAKLDMEPAVQAYAGYRSCAEKWMLNPFICPASRFDEFEQHASPLMQADDPWDLSVLVGDDLDADLDRIAGLLTRLEGKALAPAIELKALTAQHIDDAIDRVPEGVTAYFEIPWQSDCRGHVTALAGSGHAAKIRTGGVTADLIPPTDAVVPFLRACCEAEVPFKCTAGLHHPIRHHSDAVNAMMHGFLNVFGAAIVLRTQNLNDSQVGEILETVSADAFEFNGDQMRVLEWSVSKEAIEAGRTWARSFGSCSFDEPREDLKALDML